MKSIKIFAFALCASLISMSAFAQNTKTVVENAIASKDHTTLVAAIKAASLVETLSGKGSATLTTVEGSKLIGSLKGKNVILTDANGHKATITAVDIMSSNGVVHVIDSVVLPK